jgi:hypothetical protein
VAWSTLGVAGSSAPCSPALLALSRGLLAASSAYVPFSLGYPALCGGWSGKMTRVTTSPEHVKVRFALDQDEDGWPPVKSEGLWAVPLGGDQFRIDNTPWFARGISADDVVEAMAGSDGVLWATQRLESGGRQTIRVMALLDGSLSGDPEVVRAQFTPLGVTGEIAQHYRMVALDVPPGIALAPVKSLLVAGERDGRWVFDEGCVSQEWLSI